ncbi:MAG: ABC transporter permease [Odoribacter sp.]|nr:ABC transporter permease [Odoribacter sp.]
MGDADYLATYSMHLAEGRNYRRNENQKRYYNGSGKPGEAVINRKMVRELGLENPVGKVLSYGNSTVTVVGVVDDFHYKSLYQAVEPVVLGAHLPGFDNTLNIRYREGKRQEVLDYLQKYYRDNYMGIMLQYSEYSYTDLYARDVALAKMIHILTVLAILISGMGILAFSMFVVESRRKEVAMRKINGATEWQVVGLLNRGFVRKMLGACFIGLPVAYGLMVYWLQGFAYRVEIHWWLFVLDAGICLLLVLLVSTWQTRKAALQNPVDALKEG